jgi:hypothetical protein
VRVLKPRKIIPASKYQKAHYHKHHPAPLVLPLQAKDPRAKQPTPSLLLLLGPACPLHPQPNSGLKASVYLSTAAP